MTVCSGLKPGLGAVQASHDTRLLAGERGATSGAGGSQTGKGWELVPTAGEGPKSGPVGILDVPDFPPGQIRHLKNFRP